MPVLLATLLLVPLSGVVAQEEWTTYKNQDWNFSIDYPEDWGKTETSGESYFGVSFVGPTIHGVVASVQALELREEISFKKPVITKDFTVGPYTSRQIIMIKGKNLYAVTFLANPSSFKNVDTNYFKRMTDSFKIGVNP